jgi:hypothetical protein
VLLTDDIHAQFDAFITDEHSRTRDELAHFMLALAAKRAIERIFRITTRGLTHGFFRSGASFCGTMLAI